MNNWLFAICMLGVAIVISMIVTFFKLIFKIVKVKREKEAKWVTVTNAEYIDKDFLGRNIDRTREK
ncbi:hypothetical protein COJ48_18325 [Bacillus cereus]|nr:hypothetical protein COJ48_18325 [Bacillus cereus]PGP88754.1 hypothetical protein CN997_02520 [Bacillus cereus]